MAMTADNRSSSSTTSTDEDVDLKLFQQRQALKLSLMFQAQDVKRGFDATNEQRKEISKVIQQLASLNPTKEPAAAYYETIKSNAMGDNDDQGQDGRQSAPSLSGKWTLIYTDAPDITGLDPSASAAASLIPPPPPSAKLGRIGQQCNAGEKTIKNIIEWKRPDWLGNILNGAAAASTDDSSNSRVLQKVVCEASASPERPFVVDLTLVGFELVGETAPGGSSSSGGGGGASSSSEKTKLPGLASFSSILNEGPASILSKIPISLRGPLKAPFGKFEIQYLDEEIRIVKTGQGYYAVNLRESQPWF